MAAIVPRSANSRSSRSRCRSSISQSYALQEISERDLMLDPGQNDSQAPVRGRGRPAPAAAPCCARPPRTNPRTERTSLCPGPARAAAAPALRTRRPRPGLPYPGRRRGPRRPPRRGQPVLPLAFGEAGLPVLPELREVLAAAAGRNAYGPVAGLAGLRAAAAGYWDPPRPGHQPAGRGLRAGQQGAAVRAADGRRRRRRDARTRAGSATPRRPGCPAPARTWSRSRPVRAASATPACSGRPSRRPGRRPADRRGGGHDARQPDRRERVRRDRPRAGRGGGRARPGHHLR